MIGKRGVEAGTADLKLRSSGERSQAELAGAAEAAIVAARHGAEMGEKRAPSALRDFVKLRPEVEAVLQHVGLRTWDLVLIDATGLWVRDEFETRRPPRRRAGSSGSGCTGGTTRGCSAGWRPGPLEHLRRTAPRPRRTRRPEVEAAGPMADPTGRSGVERDRECDHVVRRIEGHEGRPRVSGVTRALRMIPPSIGGSPVAGVLPIRNGGGTGSRWEEGSHRRAA